MGRRKTFDEFKGEFDLLAQDEYLLLSDIYVNSRTKVKIKHTLCNKEFEMRPFNFLVNGNRCPHCYGTPKKEHDTFVYELNNINPNIEIISDYKASNIKINCKCKIDGNEWSAKPADLLMGKGCKVCGDRVGAKTRGLLQLKPHDTFVQQLNSIHNSLIKPLDKYQGANKNIRFECVVCGNIWTTHPSNLINGTKTGCPKCQTYSKGEDKIKDFLENANVQFDIHKTYEDLIGVGGKLLSYDFYISQLNLLVEYQGQQHERPTTFGNISIDEAIEKFEIQQEHDRRKRNYAKEHNIELLEIWYWDFNNIEQILSEKLNINNITKSD